MRSQGHAKQTLRNQIFSGGPLPNKMPVLSYFRCCHFVAHRMAARHLPRFGSVCHFGVHIKKTVSYVAKSVQKSGLKSGEWEDGGEGNATDRRGRRVVKKWKPNGDGNNQQLDRPAGNLIDE